MFRDLQGEFSLEASNQSQAGSDTGTNDGSDSDDE